MIVDDFWMVFHGFSDIVPWCSRSGGDDPHGLLPSGAFIDLGLLERRKKPWWLPRGGRVGFRKQHAILPSENWFFCKTLFCLWFQRFTCLVIPLDKWQDDSPYLHMPFSWAIVYECIWLCMILEGVAQPPTRCRFVSTTLPIPKYDTRRNENGGRGGEILQRTQSQWDIKKACLIFLVQKILRGW